MKSLLLIGSLLAVSVAGSSVSEEWTSFKREHGKTFRNAHEEQYRQSIFLQTSKMIEEHNAKYAAGLVSYHMKLNKFADMLPEEVSSKLNGFNKAGQLKDRKETGLRFLNPANVELPQSVDWRQKGAVTPVKDQGQCGSCWAFSTTGSLEGQVFRKTGKLVSLSEQQLVDCSSDFNNHGCNGGIMDNAFDYIKNAGGLASEQAYPYEGEDEYCRFRSSQAVKGTSVRSYVDVPKGDENALKSAVATVGPVSIAISAGNRGFMNYGGGIFSGETCESSQLDHGVLVVGYGTENGRDYWTIKNSWNAGWGEDGYIRIARNQGNVCGVASLASYPVL